MLDQACRTARNMEVKPHENENFNESGDYTNGTYTNEDSQTYQNSVDETLSVIEELESEIVQLKEGKVELLQKLKEIEEEIQKRDEALRNTSDYTLTS